jgi:hypothetical protein
MRSACGSHRPNTKLSWSEVLSDVPPQCLRREPVFLTQSSLGWVERDRIHAEAFSSAAAIVKQLSLIHNGSRRVVHSRPPELFCSSSLSAMKNSGNRY